MGLRTNVAKTVSMACQPCCALGGHSTEEYGLLMTGEVHTYWERLCQKVLYPEFNADMSAGSLASHRQVQHGVARGNLRDPPPKKSPRTYRLSLLPKACGITCMMGGCPGRDTTWSTL